MSVEEAVALALEEAMHGARTIGDRWADLTPSEQRITEMVANGMSSRQIGAELGISDRTVQGHVGRALSKLGLGSRHELQDLELPPA